MNKIQNFSYNLPVLFINVPNGLEQELYLSKIESTPLYNNVPDFKIKYIPKIVQTSIDDIK